MAKKLSLDQVRATAREPNPARFREPEALKEEPAAAPKPRKGRGAGRMAIPLGVSLFREEHTELDHLVSALRRGGLSGANRSLVVREALKRLKEETEGLSDGDIAASFLTRQAKRQGS
jgi:hypothetical protein